MLKKLKKLRDERELTVATLVAQRDEIILRIGEASSLLDARIRRLEDVIKSEVIDTGKNFECDLAVVTYEMDFNETYYESNIIWKKMRESWRDI